MKKKKYLIVSFITLFALINNVDASSSLSTSASQVYNGDSFTTTVSLNGIASWEVHVSASGPVSGCSINAADATEDAMNGSKTYSTTCTTTGTGTVNISLSGNATNENNSKESVSGSKTVQVVSRPSNNNSSNNNNSTSNRNINTNTKKEDNKSGNNDLKSFEIEDYNITPEFDKNVTDYTLTVPNGVEKIKILAYKDDDNASLSGDDGEVEVKVGENKFEVVVTAENGDKKTYNLTVTVEEKPITIKVNNNDYSIVKNKDELPKLDIEHEELTLTIQDQEVPAYRIDSINYVLIGLRDSKGTISLYKFDSFKNDEKDPTYELFNYIESKGILLINKELPKNKIPKNYKKYTEKINGYEYTVYKLNKNSKYCLIYGLNLETNKENIYKYDFKEKTLQIYDREEQKILEKNNEKYEKLIIILAGVIVVLVLLTTIGFTRKQKDNKNIDADFLTKKDIKKIEKNTKKEEKKNKNKEIKATSLDFLSKKEQKKREKKAKKNKKNIDYNE